MWSYVYHINLSVLGGGEFFFNFVIIWEFSEFQLSKISPPHYCDIGHGAAGRFMTLLSIILRGLISAIYNSALIVKNLLIIHVLELLAVVKLGVVGRNELCQTIDAQELLLPLLECSLLAGTQLLQVLVIRSSFVTGKFRIART